MRRVEGLEIRLLMIVLFACWVAIDLLGGSRVGLTEVLDPETQSPERSLLSKIADRLDRSGIDTVYGKTTDFPLREGRARVAPLLGFTPNKRDWATYRRETWAEAFKKEAIGFIAAVPKQEASKAVGKGRKQNGRQRTRVGQASEKCLKDIATLGNDVCEFVRKWLAAPPDQRVFIAFTKDDFEQAQQVGRALEDAGFAVFLFLKGRDEKPWADPAMAGEVFAQSKFRIVIDTGNARGSPGVALERECCEVFLMPPPPETAISRALKGTR